jgi:hypothetical protein
MPETAGRWFDSFGYPVSVDDCVAIQCGVHPSPPDRISICEAMGQTGTRSCIDPACQIHLKVLQSQGTCPATPTVLAVPPAAPSIMPTQASANPPAGQPASPPPVLTPQNIVQPVPDITQAWNPVPSPTQKRSFWCDINGSIDAHPAIAAAVLAIAALIVMHDGNRRKRGQ